jgi:hypothetical protein
MTEQVRHYALDSTARTPCEVLGGRVTPWAREVTCPECLAWIEQAGDAARHVHAVEVPGRWQNGRRVPPVTRCGAAGPTGLTAREATCPECLALLGVTAIRGEIERAGRSVGSVTLDLSVWEGRGDWSALPMDQRREAGGRGLVHLDESIAALEAQRGRLRAALGIEDQADEDNEDGPALACASMHEHDPKTCAAPSLAELTAETARFELLDIVARIDGSFEAAAEGEMDPHTALERTRDRLLLLLSDLGVDRRPAPILGSEDGCAGCGAHWSWTPWATEGDKAERRIQHAGACESALFGLPPAEALPDVGDGR